MGLRGWSHDFQQQIEDGHIEFRKLLISPYCLMIFAPMQFDTNVQHVARHAALSLQCRRERSDDYNLYVVVHCLSFM